MQKGPSKEHPAQVILGVKDRLVKSGGFVHALSGILGAEDGNDSLEDLDTRWYSSASDSSPTRIHPDTA